MFRRAVRKCKTALAQLQHRVPLGATDLELALKGIADSFADKSSGQRVAIYIGDGQSNANVEGNGAFDLLDRLAKDHISVHSFVVGPANNSAALAAIANQTGGTLVLDSEKTTGREAGEKLAKAAHGPVIWPTDRQMPDTLTATYPNQTPPFRLDRDTVLIGNGKADGNITVEIKGDSAGRPVDLKWNVKATPASEDNAYLAQWVDLSKRDGGRRLPTLGSEGLAEARRVSNLSAHTMAKLGQQAAAEGDVTQAKQFVDEALRRDPNNANALVLKQSIESGLLHATAQQAEKTTPVSTPTKPGEMEVPPEAPAPTDAQQAKDGDLLNSVEQAQRLVQQKVMTEATVAMSHARDHMNTDPAQVLNDMKLLFDEVMRVGELSSDQRAELRSQITALMEQASQRRFEKEANDIARQQSAAEARDRRRILDSITVKEERLKGLMDRFNALVEQGYQNADQVTNEQLRAARRDAADEFRLAAQNPYGRQPVAATTAPIFAGFTISSVENAAVRDAAERNFMDALHLVDISHIPFPDDPPIVYPSAAFWKKIDYRKKWASVDLSSKPSEQKIINALDDPNNKVDTLDFQGTPLTDVLDYIHQRYSKDVIPAFILDQAALKDAGIDPTTTLVTISVKDISLRSALKLILQPFNLTYIIKDEVPMITTKEKADATLVTRAYYVGDLVIPIQNQNVNIGQLGGGIGGGGGGGGLGGGLGGGGGGLGGGGGGGLGGGGGGGLGGGGGFDLPPEPGRLAVPSAKSGGALDVSETTAESKTASPKAEQTKPSTVSPANQTAATKSKTITVDSSTTPKNHGTIISPT